jgi:hypothetical protein
MVVYEELTKQELIFIIKSIIETKTSLSDSVAISPINKASLNRIKDTKSFNNYNDTITYLINREVTQ